MKSMETFLYGIFSPSGIIQSNQKVNQNLPMFFLTGNICFMSPTPYESSITSKMWP